jgi:hypothetical protein
MYHRSHHRGSRQSREPQHQLSSLNKYERFEKWLRENGAEFELVRSSLGHEIRSNVHS